MAPARLSRKINREQSNILITLTLLQRARMNVYTRDNVRVDFSYRLNRFSITKENEFLSLSPSSFQLLVTISRLDTEYEQITVRQHGSKIEIIKLLNNFLITFMSKTITSSVSLPGHIMESISTNYENILDFVKIQKIKHPAKGTGTPSIIQPRKKRTQDTSKEEHQDIDEASTSNNRDPFAR